MPRILKREGKKKLTLIFSRNDKNWDSLSSLGHFLKGSSATLGLIKVRDACEKIQHCKEELPDDQADKEKAIDGIKKTLKEVKSDYEEVKEGREKYKRQARGQVGNDKLAESPRGNNLTIIQDRNPFVLVLVDGDGYLVRLSCFPRDPNRSTKTSL